MILKLKQHGISGNLLKTVDKFFLIGCQSVVLSGQASGWTAVNADVPQFSVLGPLLFWVHINTLSTGLSSNSRLIADEFSNDSLKIRNWDY